MFPTLYKKTSTGAIQQWTISVNGNEIGAFFNTLVKGLVKGPVKGLFREPVAKNGRG